ncbi:translation factor Sua5 [Loktanella sp. 5RATIMAR09]|uniref:L-threonylcarbamoyladenylate synthase n=1 Tax=Loktanella sp. 5RATIMAR09 TaxID=1225655 RepID=UPI0006EB972A|nr:L-threonylcarbamoyladenylate synthase [Loktanella sp. 5RATIMAR09]KQI71598.1 translation factor Sua5 [Loktanella sp. 5RATIMAR09]
MTHEQSLILPPDVAGLEKAAALLAGGGLVSFPTETVYGLGADARNDTAVARIFAAKGRPSFNPLIVHVADLAGAETYCVFNDTARALAQAFWPGALTLVLPLRADAGVSQLVTAGLGTLGVRVPDHPVARGMLARFGGPVAAPSANPSGRVSPTTPAHVAAGLGDRTDAVVDGGACPVGVESTIVNCVGEPALLRAGGIPCEALEACLGRPLARPADPAKPTAPGQLESHYAPQGKVRLNAPYAEAGEVLLGFGPVEADLNLSVAGDLTEAAARLFACLHQLDAMGADRIAVSPIPDHGLGQAINDRLKRAAAPR